MRLIKITFLTSNISMAIKLCKVCKTFICKNVYALSESSKITRCEGLFGHVIEVKVMKNYFFVHFSLTSTLIIYSKRSLNQAILYDSDRIRFYKLMYYIP